MQFKGTPEGRALGTAMQTAKSAARKTLTTKYRDEFEALIEANMQDLGFAITDVVVREERIIPAKTVRKWAQTNGSTP